MLCNKVALWYCILASYVVEIAIFYFFAEEKSASIPSGRP